MTAEDLSETDFRKALTDGKPMIVDFGSNSCMHPLPSASSRPAKGPKGPAGKEVFRLQGFTGKETVKEQLAKMGGVVGAAQKFLDNDSDGNYISIREYLGDAMKEFIKVMKALSDPNRVKLLKMLQKKEMCVCEIQAALGIAQPTVSKHLKVLEAGGLVQREKDGLWVNYSLSDGGRSPYAASLLGNLKHWLADDPEIRDLFARSKGLRREDICRPRE